MKAPPAPQLWGEKQPGYDDIHQYPTHPIHIPKDYKDDEPVSGGSSLSHA
jgi:hypothetical protein